MPTTLMKYITAQGNLPDSLVFFWDIVLQHFKDEKRKNERKGDDPHSVHQLAGPWGARGPPPAPQAAQEDQRLQQLFQRPGAGALQINALSCRDYKMAADRIEGTQTVSQDQTGIKTKIETNFQEKATEKQLGGPYNQGR
ncbi:uncharacterized protein WM277_004026 isoform 5-T13 [Molossus nigricans]